MMHSFFSVNRYYDDIGRPEMMYVTNYRERYALVVNSQ